MNMKEIIKESFKQLIADRYLLTLLAGMMLLAIVLAIIIGLSIHPSELQLVSRYSTFGVTHFYRDQWFYLFVFVAFEIVVALLHTIISIKLLIVKGHPLAIVFAWFGVGTILLGWVAAFAVLNVWTPL
jgi:hypothetical protein